jgi:NitT/TauT family transport system ATP-binding protein
MTNGSETPPLVEVRGVTLRYKTRERLVTAACRVDLAVRKSDRFVLLAPCGREKSTLLKTVSGCLRATEGEISSKVTT